MSLYDSVPALLSQVGQAVADHLWQSTGVALLALVLTSILRRNAARSRYWVWLAASLKFLVPFSLFSALGSRFSGSHEFNGTQIIVSFVIDQTTRPFAERALPWPIEALHSASPKSFLAIPLLLLWSSGSAIVLCVSLLRWLRVSRTARRAQATHQGRETDILRSLQKSSGARTPVQLKLCQESLEPGVYGIFRPVLLWPQHLSGVLENPHIELICAHELEHVRRHDNLAALAQMLVETLFWFHPLVWWVGSRLLKERERACDEAAIASSNMRYLYAESLLKACEFCLQSPAPCVAGITGSDLKRRMVDIITWHPHPRLQRTQKLVLAGAAALLLFTPVLSGKLNANEMLARKYLLLPRFHPLPPPPPRGTLTPDKF